MYRRLEIPATKQAMVMVEEPIPEPPPDGAVIKVHYAGICQTDLHLWEDELDIGGGQVVPWSRQTKFPMVLGHEVAGEIFSLGRDVTTGEQCLQIGDHVMVTGYRGCCECKWCEAGRYDVCPRGYETSIGYNLPGGFGEYVAVPAVDMLMPVPKGLPMDIAALLPCSGNTAFGAVKMAVDSVRYYMSVEGKASVLIIGAGGLGLWGVQIARHLMPSGTEIIVAEASESKFEDATKAGADKTVLWSSESAEDNWNSCKEIAPDGVACAIDFVGAPISISSSLGCLAKTGTLVIVGEAGGEVTIPIINIVHGLHVIRGHVCGEPDLLTEVADLVVKGKVAPPPITHVKLEDAPRVLDDLKVGRSRGRNVIKYVQCEGP